MPEARPLLEGVRVLEVSILAPDILGMHLADLGADVIKIEEPPMGDYLRDLAGQVDGVSALHRRWNRGKRSLALNLRAEEGRLVFESLVKVSDVVIEGLRPDALARRGLGFDRLRELRPDIVMASISGFGQSGPYRQLASHGVGYDAYAGLAPPTPGPDEFPSIPRHTAVGFLAGPLYGALSVCAAIVSARQVGYGCHLDIAEADAAAWWNGASIDAARYTRTNGTSEAGSATGPDLSHSVRYQYYETEDSRYILFMATEAKFWQQFCSAVGRDDLYAKHPPKSHSDHDVDNLALRGELAELFRTRTQREWIDFFVANNVPGVPVHTAEGILDDPQFIARANWLSKEDHGLEMLGTPVRAVGALVNPPRAAPSVGQHSEEVLSELLSYSAAQIQELVHQGVVVAA